MTKIDNQGYGYNKNTTEQQNALKIIQLLLTIYNPN